MPITFEEALSTVLPIVKMAERVDVSLPEAVGRVLARDLVADRDIPPFPRAAMDGYAVAWTGKETEREYRVVGTVHPGSAWDGRPGESDCVRIMTGAMVPPPFDTVIRRELSEGEPGGKIRFTGPAKRGENVASQGEDVRKGAVLIPAGTHLLPHHVATLSSAGLWEVPVRRQPSVALLATGSELREPWETARGPMIRNSNSHFLLAAFRDIGFLKVRYLGIVPDERERIVAKIREGLESDFLVLSGGVSVGDVDIVPECLADLGVRKVLHGIAVQPGKPIFAGASSGGAIVIGLPGNPVAVMVHFSMFLRPLLMKASGATEYLPKPVLLPLAASASNRTGRKKFALARLDSSGGETRVAEIPSHGSGDFVSAVRADGVFEIPLGTSHLPAGRVVPFYPIWGKFLSEEG